MSARLSRKLGELKCGESAIIVAVEGELSQRLLEMGLLEGCRVEVAHEGPFGGDPVAVRVRGGLIALRRGEANQIEVSV